MKLFIVIFISMNRLDKCQILKEKGYTYNPENGKIYGAKGNELKTYNKNGYLIIRRCKLFSSQVMGHHFAWYMYHGNLDFIELDHINTNKTDNRILNLRSSNRNQQTQNTNAKGYSFNKKMNKYHAEIRFYNKRKHLGYFNSEEEARQAYLDAKKLYHNI